MIKLFDKFRQNRHLKFLTGVAALLITVASLDFIIGKLLNTFYFKQKSGLQYRTTYSIEKATASLLIFGSSTANHNYEPDMLKKTLDTSIYNTGRDGNSIFYDYALLLAILKRYSPKIIILDFDEQEFVKDEDSYDRLSSLLPYYGSHPEIRSIVDLRSRYEKYKLFSHIYPFNSSIFTIAVGNMEFNKQRRNDIDGYVPLTNVWNQPIKDEKKYLNRELDSNKIGCYKSFVRNCIDKKIKLYVICSPIFIKSRYLSNSIATGENIANAFNIPFFDYSQDAEFLKNPKLFADVNHLNEGGANIFSGRIASRILACKMEK